MKLKNKKTVEENVKMERKVKEVELDRDMLYSYRDEHCCNNCFYYDPINNEEGWCRNTKVYAIDWCKNWK